MRGKTIRGWVNVLAFPECPSICLVLSLREYSDRTAPLHHTVANMMLITLGKPYKSVSSQSMAQWMTIIMIAGGVDIYMFKLHSTCSASATWSENGTMTMLSRSPMSGLG